MPRRLHTELLVQVATDLTLENIEAEKDFSQNDDTLTLFKTEIVTLAASAGATEITKPLGGGTIKFLAILDVDSASGINVRLGGAANDPVLVAPPTSSASSTKYGYFVSSVSTSSLHVDNPSSSSSVSARIIIGCSTA